MVSVYHRVRKFKEKYPYTLVFRLKKHAEVVQNVLDPDENVLYTFCGQRNDAARFIFDSCVVALTNKRLIIGGKRIIGYYVITVSPELFNDLKLNARIIFGQVEIDTVKENIFISNIDKRALDEIETRIQDIMLKNKNRMKKKVNS